MQNLNNNRFAPAMRDTTWRLSTSKLPQRVELDLPAEIHACLEQLSARSGRSLRDLAEDLIHRSASRQQDARHWPHPSALATPQNPGFNGVKEQSQQH